MNLRDALGIGDERDDVIDMAARFFTVCLVYILSELLFVSTFSPSLNSIYLLKMAVEQNFTKGRRTELVQASCLYLTCRLDS